jgi:hypothetical protein
MRFVDEYVSREGRFSVGRDRQGDRPFLSIPVRNSKVEYEEYYALAPEEYARFSRDRTAALAFAEECRARWRDDRLILEPGSDRGEPV